MLDHLLSEHPQIAGLGEVHRLSMSLRRSTAPHYCSCGRAVSECGFWHPVLREIQADIAPRSLEDLLTTDPVNFSVPDSLDMVNVDEPIPSGGIGYAMSLSKLALATRLPVLQAIAMPLLPGLRVQRVIARDSSVLFRAVRKVHGARIVTDCTKTPGRLMALAQWGEFDRIHVLYLVRNGLAVAAARMRRQGIPMRQAALIWLQEHRKIAWALSSLSNAGKVTVIKYEDLCRDPRSVLRVIASALSIENPDGWGLRVPKGGYHGLGGNPMRWRSSEKDIVLDERWKDDLSMEDREHFNRVAGRLNARFGYL
jgi:hypothetical protein